MLIIIALLPLNVCLLITQLCNIIVLKGWCFMDNRFIIKAEHKPSVTVTVRIDGASNERLESIAFKSGLSRNKIINMAIKFALENLEFVDEAADENKA